VQARRSARRACLFHHAALAVQEQDGDRSPQMGGGTAFGMGITAGVGVLSAREHRRCRHGSVIQMQRGLGIRQARRTASGLSSFSGHAALAVQGGSRCGRSKESPLAGAA
jgi:hypothetical protein